jgi:predicted Zn-dependent protease
MIPKQAREGINVSPTHPLRELVVLLAGIAGVLTVVFIVLAVGIEFTVPLIPPSVEAKVFSGFGDLTLDIIETDEVDTWVVEVLERVARHWEDNPYQLKVRVMKSEDVNAVALPGGVIAVTSGLLEAIEDERELAFVLAHELGHFAHRDHLRRLGRGTILSLLVATLSGGGAPRPAVDLVAHLETATSLGFDRRQELAADRFALEVVVAEYGDVAGGITFFERVRDLSEELDAHGWLPYLRTHPLPEERLQAVRDAAQEHGWATETG